MNNDMWNLQREALQRRVAGLYQHATSAPTSELVTSAFDELQCALELLQSAEALMRQQRLETADAVNACQQEHQNAIDVFNSVPTAYVITSADGTIRKLNEPAVAFFNQTAKFLVGKSLGLFIPEGERRAFRSELAQFQGMAEACEYELRLQPNGARPQPVLATVAPVRDRAGRVSALHWLLRATPALRELEVGGASGSFVNA